MQKASSYNEIHVIQTFGLRSCNPSLLEPNQLRMYGLLTKCEVKMAGYWPGSFFCVFRDRDGVEVRKLARKERGQYTAILTEQASVGQYGF